MGPVRAAAFAVLLLGCGGERGDAGPPPVRAGAAVASVAADEGDLLLARARLSIEGGVLAPELSGRLLDSRAPEHARAVRLLTAMRDGIVPLPASDDDPLAAPAVPAAADPPALIPGPPPTEGAAPTAAPDAASAPAPVPAPAPARAAATLERVSMQATKRGAALTIHASSGVLVGVVNQPEAGIVRLALDDVRAAPKVLSSRPGVTGARVKSIDAGSGSVRITLSLAQGWRFGGVRRTPTGARVELVGPS